MKKILGLAVVLCLGAVLLWSFFVEDDGKALITFPNGESMRVDVADDPSKQAQGLSNRTEPQSMLFLFAQKSIPAFWMKDMNFAIDILWLDGERIVGIEKNMQPENPAQTFYRSKTPINGALEVPAGTVDELSLQVGDQLDITWKAQ